MFVSERPSEDTMENWELEWVRTDTPEERWETDHGETIEIYADRVEIDGNERGIGPEEAKEKCREQDHMSRLEQPAEGNN